MNAEQLTVKHTNSLANSNTNRLFTTTSICEKYCIDVSELMSCIEEEILRCVSARGYPEDTKIFQKYNEEAALPTKCISRDVFTQIWMDSFSFTA